jgi:hypothetical protein
MSGLLAESAHVRESVSDLRRSYACQRILGCPDSQSMQSRISPIGSLPPRSLTQPSTVEILVFRRGHIPAYLNDPGKGGVGGGGG